MRSKKELFVVSVLNLTKIDLQEVVLGGNVRIFAFFYKLAQCFNYTGRFR
jgi:hypothetical protein